MSKPAELMIFTYEQLAECAQREVKYRQWVYPQRIGAGKMTQRLADAQIAMMEAIAKHFEELAQKERLL